MRGKLVGLGGWLKNSFIDFPGTVSTVLFFSGCNCRCSFCHNPLLVNRAVDQSFRSDEVWDFLEARKGLIEGVVITGGEPTLYPELKRTIAEMKKMGYRIKLDTNGLLPDIAESFHADYLAVDLKTSPSRYRDLCQATFDDIGERLAHSIGMVKMMGENAEVRMTVAPGYIDAQAIRDLLPLVRGVKKVFLQPMEQSVELLDPVYMSITPVSKTEMHEVRDMLASEVGACVIRGEDSATSLS